MFKNLRKIVLGLLAVCLTGALGAGVAFGVEVHAEETVAGVKAFKSTQINLNESITVRYNLTVPAGYTGAEMTFTVGEGGSPITAEPKTGLTEGQNITFELKNIGPQNMADKITATVTFTGKNGETGVETYEMSVKEYCQTLLKNAAAGKADGIDAQEKFDALKTLASSLLVYGDEAQKYIGKEATSTTGLTVAQKNAALKAQASSSDLSFSGEAYKGLLWSGATLWFGNKVNLIYYFKADSALQAKGTLGVKVGESFIEAQVGETVDGYTEYSATYEGLSVTEFDSVIGARVAYKTTEGVVTEVGKTANYSVKSYVLRAPEADKALAEAAYSYGVAAKAYTEALGNTEAPANFGEMLEKGYGVTYGTERVVDYGTSLGSTFVYHTATDGMYLYTLAAAYGQEKTVSRINLQDYSKEVTSAKIGNISEQDIAMFVKDGTIYVWTTSGFKTLPTNFTADTEVGSATLTFGSLTTYQGIAYDEAKGYAVLSGNKIYYFDKQFAQVGEAVSIPATQTAVKRNGTVVSVGSITNNNGKRMFTDGKYVYINYWGGNTVTPSLRIYDWNGNLVGIQIVPVSSDVHQRQDDSFHIQSAVMINDELYFTILSWGTPGNSALFKTTFTATLKNSVGEYYELANKTINLDNADFIRVTGNGLSEFDHGFATKGNYGYISSSASATQINVTKFDLTTKTTLGYMSVSVGTITGTEKWNLKSRLFIYGENIYVVCENNKKIYGGSLSAFATDGSAKMTEVTGFFGSVSNVETVTYNEAKDMFVARVGQKLYVGKKDSLKEVATLPWTGSYTGLYSDSDYIYILAENPAGYGTVKMAIYTWDGKSVTNGWYDNALKISKAFDNNNVQGMFVANGKVYFLVCQWGSSTKVDENGEKIPQTNEDGSVKKDGKGNIVYQTEYSSGAYVVSGYLDTSKIA